MRAVTLESVPVNPAVADIDTPSAGAGELLVKVAFSSVNGFDAAAAAGYLRDMMEHRFPLVVGMDFAGTVEALGEGVDGFAVGDTVFGVAVKPYLGAGSLADHVAVTAGHGVTCVPEGVSARDAGALGLAGSAALDSVNAVDPQKGETVLVSGATGGVGALAVQIAVSRGARVIATAWPGVETDFVTGLTEADVRLVDFTGDLDSQVRALTPNGVDTVLHLAGDGAQLAGLLRPGGRIASTLGFGPEAVDGQDITAFSVIADSNTRTLTELAANAASGALRVPVTATYALEQAPDAFAAFGAGALGKLAVSIDAS